MEWAFAVILSVISQIIRSKPNHEQITHKT